MVDYLINDHDDGAHDHDKPVRGGRGTEHSDGDDDDGQDDGDGDGEPVRGGNGTVCLGAPRLLCSG